MQFAVVEGATCDNTLDDSDFGDVSDDKTVDLEAGQVESQVYVCVRGIQEDGTYVYALKQAGEVAETETGTEPGTGTNEEGDEDDGGSNTFLIVIIVIGVIAVGIVVAIMLSSKKN